MSGSKKVEKSYQGPFPHSSFSLSLFFLKKRIVPLKNNLHLLLQIINLYSLIQFDFIDKDTYTFNRTHSLSLLSCCVLWKIWCTSFDGASLNNDYCYQRHHNDNLPDGCHHTTLTVQIISTRERPWRTCASKEGPDSKHSVNSMYDYHGARETKGTMLAGRLFWPAGRRYGRLYSWYPTHRPHGLPLFFSTSTSTFTALFTILIPIPSPSRQRYLSYLIACYSFWTRQVLGSFGLVLAIKYTLIFTALMMVVSLFPLLSHSLSLLINIV